MFSAAPLNSHMYEAAGLESAEQERLTWDPEIYAILSGVTVIMGSLGPSVNSEGHRDV